MHRLAGLFITLWICWVDIEFVAAQTRVPHKLRHLVRPGVA